MADGILPADHQVLSNPYGGKGPLVMAVTWAECSVALVLMLMRTYTNAFIVKSFKWDYYWALFTFVTALIAQCMITVSTLSGLGNHFRLLFGPQLVRTNLWSWIGQIVVVQAIGFGKIAVIAFLLRIQDRTQSRKNTALVWLLYFIGFSNVVINIDQMILILLQCDPVPKLWDPLIPGTCDHIHRTNNVAYFQGSWAAMSDMVLAIYPVIVFWNLKISLRIKAGLCLLMAGGLVAAAAGIVKTINLKSISASHDITYFIADLVIWAYTECYLVLILGSLPPLRPLFINCFQTLTSSYHGQRRSTAYKNSHTYALSANNYHHPYSKTTDKSQPNIIPLDPLKNSRDPAAANFPTFYTTATRGDLDHDSAVSTETAVLGKDASDLESQRRGWERGKIEEGPYIVRTTHVHVGVEPDLERGETGGEGDMEQRSRRRSDQSVAVGKGMPY